MSLAAQLSKWSRLRRRFHTAGRKPAPFEIATYNAVLARKMCATLAVRNGAPEPGPIFWLKPWLDETKFNSQG